MVTRQSASAVVWNEAERRALILSGILAVIGCTRRLPAPPFSPAKAQRQSGLIFSSPAGLLQTGRVIDKPLPCGVFLQTDSGSAACVLWGAPVYSGSPCRREKGRQAPFAFLLRADKCRPPLGFWRFMRKEENPAWERLEGEAA